MMRKADASTLMMCPDLVAGAAGRRRTRLGSSLRRGFLENVSPTWLADGGCVRNKYTGGATLRR